MNLTVDSLMVLTILKSIGSLQNKEALHVSGKKKHYKCRSYRQLIEYPSSEEQVFIFWIVIYVISLDNILK